MSQENIEIVRTALAALDQGDVERYLRVASSEIELITPASALEGPTVGHEGIRRFFGEMEAFSESSSFEVVEIRSVGSRVLALFTLTAVGRMSAAETSLELAGIYSIEDGKLRRVHIYADRREALEAIGLSD